MHTLPTYTYIIYTYISTYLHTIYIYMLRSYMKLYINILHIQIIQKYIHIHKHKMHSHHVYYILYTYSLTHLRFTCVCIHISIWFDIDIYQHNVDISKSF